ncbi:hypothetical protein H4R23_002937 [Coemansia sp. Cherry 401B]|nr:hypothetical protein H4R23_002937 [Coemansia sp. Cherry 401B]
MFATVKNIFKRVATRIAHHHHHHHYHHFHFHRHTDKAASDAARLADMKEALVRQRAANAELETAIKDRRAIQDRLNEECKATVALARMRAEMIEEIQEEIWSCQDRMVELKPARQAMANMLQEADDIKAKTAKVREYIRERRAQTDELQEELDQKEELCDQIRTNVEEMWAEKNRGDAEIEKLREEVGSIASTLRAGRHGTAAEYLETLRMRNKCGLKAISQLQGKLDGLSRQQMVPAFEFVGAR